MHMAATRQATISTHPASKQAARRAHGISRGRPGRLTIVPFPASTAGPGRREHHMMSPELATGDRRLTTDYRLPKPLFPLSRTPSRDSIRIKIPPKRRRDPATTNNQPGNLPAPKGASQMDIRTAGQTTISTQPLNPAIEAMHEWAHQLQCRRAGGICRASHESVWMSLDIP